MIDSDVYALTEKAKFDETTENIQYVTYFPSQGSDINGYTDLRIYISGKEYYYLPSQAYLTLRGVLKKAGTSVANGDKGGEKFTGNEDIVMVNFAPLFLFQKLSWRIGDRDVETVDNPGQTVSMLSHMLFNESFKHSDGLSMCWYPDTDNTANEGTNEGFKARKNWIFADTSDKGSFTFRIPLKYIFGFAYDYDRVIYGFNHCLSLVRQADYHALYKKTSSVDSGKIELSSITLHMPVLTPTVDTKGRLLDIVKNKNPVNINFRERRGMNIDIPDALTLFDWQLSTIALPKRPKYCFVCFQADTNKTDQTKNYALFDNANMASMSISVNNWRYSLHDQIPSDFANNYFQEFYRSFLNTREHMYGIDNMINMSHVSPEKYRKLYPIYAFDLTRHKEEISSQTVTTVLHLQFKAALAKPLRCYVLIVSDTEVVLSNQGVVVL